MRFETRIRKLEAGMITDPVILFLADGTRREIRGPRHFLLNLFCGVCTPAKLSPGQAEQLELIRHSVAWHEPGGGRMLELIRCFQHGPAEEGGRGSPASCYADGATLDQSE